MIKHDVEFIRGFCIGIKQKTLKIFWEIFIKKIQNFNFLNIFVGLYKSPSLIYEINTKLDLAMTVEMFEPVNSLSF